jgi:cytochrome b561
MAAQAEPAVDPVAQAYSGQRMPRLFYGCATLLVVAIGVAGLLEGSRLRQMLEPWIEVHALFGLLLSGLVIARYRWWVMHSPDMVPADIRQLSRHLSRIVYLLLYVVIGVRQSVAIINSIWHGSAADFNLFDDRFRNGPDRAGWSPKDDLQMFIAMGLFVLIIVRVLAFRLWLRSVELDPPSNEATRTSVPLVLLRRSRARRR